MPCLAVGPILVRSPGQVNLVHLTVRYSPDGVVIVQRFRLLGYVTWVGDIEVSYISIIVISLYAQRYGRYTGGGFFTS